MNVYEINNGYKVIIMYYDVHRILVYNCQRDFHFHDLVSHMRRSWTDVVTIERVIPST